MIEEKVYSLSEYLDQSINLNTDLEFAFVQLIDTCSNRLLVESEFQLSK